MALRALLVEPAMGWWNETRDVVRHYSASKLRGDLVAGLTVAVVAVPQSMAYALIAEVPPQYGLYTLIFQCLIGSIFNSQPLLSVGPINTQSLLVGAIATRLGDPGDVNTYLSLVVGLTLLKGLIQLGFAILQVGGLVRYISHSVIVGFTAGAGVLIAAGQLHDFLGVDRGPRENLWPGLVGILQRVGPYVGEVHGWTLGLGVLSLVLLLVCRRIHRMIPGALIAVVAPALLVWALDLASQGVRVLPALPTGLPSPEIPLSGMSVLQIESMLPGALALALLGLMEAYSIGRTLAARNGATISANRELFSQGFTNTVTSFLSCIPGSGSFSRSALNAYAGGQTFVAGWVNALAVLVILLVAGPLARYVPMSSIAAVLLVIAAGLIDWRYFLKMMRSNKADAATLIGTFGATLLAPLAYSVFIGIALNVALYLRRAGQVYMTELVEEGGEGQKRFIERPLREHASDQAIVFLQLEGNLFFAAADELYERLSAVHRGPAKAVILRLKRTHLVDASVMAVLERFAQQMKQERRHVLLCGLRPRMKERMDEFGITAVVGEEQVFLTTGEPFQAARAAIHRAKQLVGEPTDTPTYPLIAGARHEPPTGAWCFVI